MSSPGWEKMEILKAWSVPALLHIAARIANIWRHFLYAVEADQKENDVQTESELAQQRMDKEDKVIFSIWRMRSSAVRWAVCLH